MAGYGIGRVPRDVDQTAEQLARVEAERFMAAMPGQERPAGEPLRCRRCGQRGQRGEYPFTTYGHTYRNGTGVCDDC